ncbi:MAG: 4-(cytidine 5'-diphospho)-2-C-methyl-D-erythritol kinase [Ruminococcaceae bacterium]|nr:4-(cytidine 5'-diphospho)-2-C-methyl-D-erythritol kinase [Oscillospiraceae bacterium]
MKISVKAYAKINLFLDMVAKRNDGYHDIMSLMQSVSLCDTITVEYTNSDDKIISLACNSPSIPCDERNLAYKAAQKYPFEKGRVDITIDKNIPVSAGLAGGSADAAAVLVALNALLGAYVDCEDLIALGATLGADVPFCIQCGTYLTEGIGERMSSFVSMPNYPIVIAKKGEGMSTPMAYRMLDDKHDDFIGYSPNVDKLDILRHNEADIKTYCMGIYNIFEEVVEPERPCVTELKRIMTESGAINATMSGSGTSVFGIFKDLESARKSLDALIARGADAHLCFPCDSCNRISL